MPCEPKDDIIMAAGELKFSESSPKAVAPRGVDDGCEDVLTLWEWPCPEAGVFVAGDLWERLRAIAAEVGGRGDGNMGVGVAMDAFLGVEPECGLAALGVAIVVLKRVPFLYPLQLESPATCYHGDHTALASPNAIVHSRCA
jgi:hypothetical protein